MACTVNKKASSFRSAQAATLLEFHVPLTNFFVRRWFCAVHCPKPPLHRHNWLSFGKFQDTERFLIHCARHFSSRLPRSGGTRKYAKAPSTKKNFERFCTYWYAPFCPVFLGCCAVEFGSSGGTYEKPCAVLLSFLSWCWKWDKGHNVFCRWGCTQSFLLLSSYRCTYLDLQELPRPVNPTCTVLRTCVTGVDCSVCWYKIVCQYCRLVRYCCRQECQWCRLACLLK